MSDMASVVGWATFALAHIVFALALALALVLGLIVLRSAPAEGVTAAVVHTRSAMLSR